jgi:hypothetical protein
MKRLKRVYSSWESVIRLFVEGKQDSARCKNAFFRNRDLYSYGPHYLLARKGLKINGVNVMFVNAEKVSMTTSGQSRHVARLLGNKRILFIECSMHSHRISSASTDKDVIEAVEEHLSKLSDCYQQNLLEATFNPCMVSLKTIKKHNKLLERLGLHDLVVILDQEQVKAKREYMRRYLEACQAIRCKQQTMLLL